MNDHADREERAIFAALERLEGAPEGGDALPDAARAEDSEADATLRRLNVETLGLLPWALEPETPSAGARERLLAALPATEEGTGADVRPMRPARPARRSAGTEPEAAPPPPPSRRPSRWPAALAAALTAAALGLAGVAGWLWLELDRTRDSLAEAEAHRSELTDRVARQEEQIRRRAGMEKLVSATTIAGVEVCPLRPVGDPALRPEAFAVLYMPPGSDEWYLVASNLGAEEAGVYRVWLNTPDGALPVGRLGSPESSTLEFSPPSAIQERPERMLSIAVTLEPDPETESPTGPMVLFGDEKMTVL